jgi:hypothetical protein
MGQGCGLPDAVAPKEDILHPEVTILFNSLC